MSSAAEFSLKVWLVAIFLSPLLIPGIGFSSFYFFALLYSIKYSVPSLILFIVVTYFINKMDLSMLIKKSILIAVGILFTYFSLEVLFNAGLSYGFLIYSAVLTAAILWFTLNAPVPAREATID